jgi:hypothetical protein
VVEPDRLRRDILDLLPNAVSARARLLHASPWLTQWSQRWDAVNAWWNDHVVKFDYRSQLGLLSWMGIPSPDLRHLGWAFVVALLGWLSWIAWHVGRSGGAAPPDRLAQAYKRLCAKLARAGLHRDPHQGPLAYADAVTERRPDVASSVRSLLMKYAELRYGPPRADSQRAEIIAFERTVARLTVPRR